jgi:hypothetical protein
VSLAGIVLVSPTSGGAERTHTVTTGMMPSGDHFVFALSSSPTDNHGLMLDYAYGSGSAADIILNNGADWLELRTSDGTAIDRVTWPSGGFTHSRSRQFPTGLPTSMNGDWARWCDSTDVYSMTGGTFYGTPGLANAAGCP